MQQTWTRRRFLQTAGLTVVAQRARATSAIHPQYDATHAYVAVQQNGVREGIQILRSNSGSWQNIQFIDSAAPCGVLLNVGSGLLFVANALTHFQGLPTGSVESYRIDPQSHTITLVGRQRLGLASVMPHALALSPDGSLLVAAAAAGLYNILPVARDGMIGEVTAVRKELRFDTGSSTRMLFVSGNQLKVQDVLGTRLYQCDRDGMNLLRDSSEQIPPRSLETPRLVQGQRSVAFAHFA